MSWFIEVKLPYLKWKRPFVVLSRGLHDKHWNRVTTFRKWCMLVARLSCLLISFQELIGKMLETILMYYINMGAAQFLRDFRRECSIQKSAELRKRVLHRREKNKEKTDHVPFQVFIAFKFSYIWYWTSISFVSFYDRKPYIRSASIHVCFF